MTAVRPPVWPTVQPTQTGGAGTAKTAAQRAFFEAALGKTAAPQAQTRTVAVRAETAPQPAAQPVRNTTFSQPSEQPQKILRPGSLLDIRV